MGYNTTIVVMNDALDTIAKDPEFGKRLSDAIAEAGFRRKPVDVSAHGGNCIHVNAATVIECHHADQNVLVRVGGNHGEALHYEDARVAELAIQRHAKKRSAPTTSAEQK